MPCVTPIPCAKPNPCALPSARDCQPFPKPSPLRIDVDLDELRELCADALGLNTLYSYVITSVELHDGRFVQKGSAPNWQGKYVTLCTCKHRMRTSVSCKAWPGRWVAGFTSRRKVPPPHKLVYLMRVGWAFDSHLNMWRSPDLPQDMKRAKAAHLDKYGDLFWPRSPSLGHDSPARHKKSSYKPPIVGHVHEHGYENDIHHFGFSGRPAALLVGDPDYTFIWRGPSVSTDRQLWIGHKKWALRDFLSQLKEVSQ